MDIFCNLVQQTFAVAIRHAGVREHILTQDNDQPIRLYLLVPSGNPGGSHPFSYDPASGDSSVQCIISLRDVRAFPVTLASSPVMTVIRDGFSAVFHIGTQEIRDYLFGISERPAAFCVDLIDGSGNKLSVFQRQITLRAYDTGVGEVTLVSPGFFYLPGITGYIGGGTTNADGITSIGRALGSLFKIVVAGSESDWRLEAGTANTDLEAGIIKLLDSGKNLVRVGGL